MARSANAGVREPLRRCGLPDAQPHLKSEDSPAGLAVNVEAVGARRPFGQALFAQVMSAGVGGSAAQPVLEVELEAEALLVVKRKTGIAQRSQIATEQPRPLENESARAQLIHVTSWPRLGSWPVDRQHPSKMTGVCIIPTRRFQRCLEGQHGVLTGRGRRLLVWGCMFARVSVERHPGSTTSPTTSPSRCGSDRRWGRRVMASRRGVSLAAVAGAASVIPARLEKTAQGPASSVATGSSDEFRRVRESCRETEAQLPRPKRDEP